MTTGRIAKTKRSKAVSKNFLAVWFQVAKNISKRLSSLTPQPTENDVKQYINGLKQIKSLDGKTKQRLLPELRRRAKTIVYGQKLVYFLRFAIRNALLLALISSFPDILIPHNFNVYSFLSLSPLNDVDRLFSVDFALCVLILPLGMILFCDYYIPNKFDLWRIISRISKALSVVLNVEIAVILSILIINKAGLHIQRSSNDAISIIGSVIIISPFIYFISEFLIDYILDYVDSVLYRFTIRKDESIVIHDLLRLLRFLSRSPEKHYLVQFCKGYIIAYLGIIIEDLPKTIRDPFNGKDNYFNSWLSVNTEGIIRSLNKKRELVINSKAGTIPAVERSLTKLFIALLTGEWGLIEKVDMPLQAKLSWKSRAYKDISNILVGLLPIVVIFLVQNLRIIDNSLLGDLYFIAILWAMLNLLMIIDPSFLEKLRLTKDVAGLFNKP